MSETSDAKAPTMASSMKLAEGDTVARGLGVGPWHLPSARLAFLPKKAWTDNYGPGYPTLPGSYDSMKAVASIPPVLSGKHLHVWSKLTGSIQQSQIRMTVIGNLAHRSKEQVEEALVSSLPKCTAKIWCESDKEGVGDPVHWNLQLWVQSWETVEPLNFDRSACRKNTIIVPIERLVNFDIQTNLSRRRWSLSCKNGSKFSRGASGQGDERTASGNENVRIREEGR
ncbi:uncharacterized protein F5891DRAFT_989373 [Suillus fuscotomentosus]|uniref:Uncharacterized protein n=1 Tax=Suillus fuscotomentosus TaxID=1912939 RepID=A0AAD4HBV3_9AGAM|nr:uncharacterized protein F5891DRAFT_989373 [Suillus fuscotomentosus]KAG1885883.1 hypothetical protein F5891DRAFT_989373 [Suillus fuscotomentosus]